MKGSIVIAFWIALIIAVLPARAHAQVSHNGIAWKHLPELMRKGYVSGVIDGTFDEMSLADAKGYGSVEQTWMKAQTSLLVRKDGRTPSVQEIEDGVASFYRVPANLPVCMVHAVEVEWLSLAGNPMSASDIAAYRKQDGRSGCK